MLKRFLTCLIPLIVLAALSLTPAVAEVNVGLSIDKDGVKGFYLAIGEHYKVAEKEIVIVHERSIPDADLPVVFHIARHAGVGHQEVIALRLKGMSWIDITFHYGLTAEIFYVQLKRKPGPPYGKAWGQFKKGRNGKEGWKSIRLADPDVVNYVNLRFLSDRYGYSPDDVVRMRAKGASFVSINGKIKKEKHKKKAHQMADSDPGEKPPKNHGKKWK